MSQQKPADLQEMFGRDPVAEREGVWVDLLPGVRFLIARNNTPAYQKALRETYAPYEMMIRDIPPELDAELNVKVISKSILKGWDGVTMNDEPLEYNEANVTKLLTDLPEIREWVWQQSSRSALYRAKSVKAMGKD